MTSSDYIHDNDWADQEWLDSGAWEQNSIDSQVSAGQTMLLAAVLIAVALCWGALSLARHSGDISPVNPPPAFEQESEPVPPQTFVPLINEPSAIVFPYDNYVVTQGVHGLSYGHMAVDIAAGKGQPINSPISGYISGSYVDAVGNPTLVIENDYYRVTLLHGIYSVKFGDTVSIGDKIGVESNIGNTRDMQGVSCRNRDCGYHTHLNVFDKEAGTNINPLQLIIN